VDAAAVAGARLDLYMTQGRSDRAVEVCLEYLRHIGVDWSPHPTEEEVHEEYERFWRRLGSRPIEELIDLPPMTDPACRATLDVVLQAHGPALCTDENLLCLLVGHMSNLSLEHGNSDSSGLAYVYLGTILGPHFGQYQAGCRFGKLGLDLVEKRDLLHFKAR